MSEECDHKDSLKPTDISKILPKAIIDKNDGFECEKCGRLILKEKKK